MSSIVSLSARPWMVFAVPVLWLASNAAQAAPLQPKPGQLAALCDTCAMVTEVKVDNRKGKATGLGAAGGAVAGGVVGKQIGDSTGATVGGAVIGGVIGHQVEKKLKSHKVWVVDAVRRDGSALHQEFDADPQFKAGDVVEPDANGLMKKRIGGAAKTITR